MSLDTALLQELKPDLDISPLQQRLSERESIISSTAAVPYRKASCALDLYADEIILDDAIVSIGRADQLDRQKANTLNEVMKTFIPWRKGPFRLFGVEVDAEWRSDLKWNRFSAHLDELAGKVVCDVGCNNGYHLFRIAAAKPAMALGIDPVAKFYYNFQFLQRMARVPNIAMEPLGWQDLQALPSVFDITFCMGILYHHRNPLEVLERCYETLKPGGQLVLETLALDSNEDISLSPEGRYAKMRNVWFIPSERATLNWLKRCGYVDAQCHYNEVLHFEEQRRTEWAPFDSLEQFLDPDDQSLTIEGYPRPRRAYFTARKSKR